MDPITPLSIVRTLEHQQEQYREAARQQQRTAVANLAQTLPDYSAAATACHRALQFTRCAEALERLAVDAGLAGS